HAVSRIKSDIPATPYLAPSFRGDAPASNPEISRFIMRNCNWGSPFGRPGMMRMTLAPPRGEAAVDGKNHARRVTRAVGGEIRHQVANLARMRGPAERQAFLEFLVAALVAELVLRPGLEQRDVAVGADRPRIDADHADVVGEALAAERA